MKAIFLIISLALSVSVGAQTVIDKPIVCTETATLLSSLASEEINERIHWGGKSDENESNYFLFVNQKTKTWTLVQLNEKIACILGTGLRSTDAKTIQVKR